MQPHWVHQSLQKKEEFVWAMMQKWSDEATNGAVKGGACIIHGAKVKRCSHGGCTNHSKKEEFVWDMKQREIDEAKRDAPMDLLREEFAEPWCEGETMRCYQVRK